MTLYFDTKVEFVDGSSANRNAVCIRWHPTAPLFAVAYSQDGGGTVMIFTDAGEPQRDITFPVHSTAQATALAWHPERILLASGWENGEIHIWLDQHREFASVQNSPHKAAIVLLEFSEQGGRLVTADAMGMLTGWRCDGQYQFLMMFSHDLREELIYLTFRRTIESEAREEMATLAKAAVAGDESALDALLTNWRPRTAARSLTHAGVKDNFCFYVGTKTGLAYYINQGGACNEVMRAGATPPVMQMLWHPKKDAVICLLEDMSVVLYLVESTGILTELDRVKLSSRAPGRSGAICWAGHSLAIITGDFTVRIWDLEQNDNYLLKMDLPNSAVQSKISGTSEAAATTGSFSLSNGLLTSSQDSEVDYQTSAPLRKYTKLPQTQELFTCLAYCVGQQILCAGTNLGQLYTWQNSCYASQETWQLTNITAVHGTICGIDWGTNELAKSCILVNCVSQVYVLKEQPLLSSHMRDLSVVQQTAKSLRVQHTNGRSCTVLAEHAITALALSHINLVISNGRSITTYNIEHNAKDVHEDEVITISTSSSGGGGAPVIGNGAGGSSAPSMPLVVKLMQSFSAECFGLGLQNQSIYCLTASDVIVYSIGGVVLNKIQANDNEGKIIGMDLSGAYLCVFTMNGFIKTYDVSRHEPRLLFPARSGYDLFADFGEFILAKCNSVGTHLAIIIANRSFVPQPVVHCWNFERNRQMEYSVGQLNQLENEQEKDLDQQKQQQLEQEKQITSRKSSLPVRLCWDIEEPRLLAVEVKSMQQSTSSHDKKLKHQTQPPAAAAAAAHAIEAQVLVLFHSEMKNKLNKLESLELGVGEQLISMCVPHVVMLDINAVRLQPLQDFVDLPQSDVNTRKLVLNFSLHVAEGNMDMAYRCIRSIKSKTIWTNLARMCVQTRRLDVAKVCMGHLEQARSVRALRQAMQDDDLELEAQVATLAIELGQLEQAKELYTSCGRADLLNKLLQQSGQLDAAIVVAETDDRVHLKHTYYQKAEALRERGDIKGALEYYEKTQQPVQHITQMLLENPTALKRYMQSTTDPRMLKWWGQYIESSGDMDAALAIYQKAEDWFSQVKILCYLGRIAKADAVARQSGDRAACYHLARHYENVGKFQEAIMFYTRAQTFGNAIRVCKENDYQDELWTVASSARSRDKAIAAAYFEECGSFRRAVELYHRAGMVHKALEMAFESEQPEILEVIASELTSNSDAELINRCADFFTSIEQHQKAVQLLAKTRHPQRALQICAERGVPITEELAELLTPLKDEIRDEEERVAILMQLGELLQQQGDYHAATKKFTQAGDKVRGMKSLLKSGNTEKIIFFASMSRQREVYIMAANYLQALDWQQDANVLKHIITFYTKAQAYDSLANFYAICAQLEIEEFHDYEKSLKAMQEAAKCLEKLGAHSQHALTNLRRTIDDVKAILNAQASLKAGDNQSVIAQCRTMLVRPELPPIRHSDILAMLVRAFTYAKQYNEAASTLKELAIKENSWSALGLVDKPLVQRIAKECNLDFDIIWNSGLGRQQITAAGNNEQGDDDDDDEEIQEELH